MLLKEKWEALYDFSQDREEYDRLCAEMCYNAENNIECAKKLNKLSKKLEFKDTIDNSLLDLNLLEELKDDDKEFISHWIHIQKCLEANDYTTIMTNLNKNQKLVEFISNISKYMNTSDYYTDSID